jgi:hypothetical protein
LSDLQDQSSNEHLVRSEKREPLCKTTCLVYKIRAASSD